MNTQSIPNPEPGIMQMPPEFENIPINVVSNFIPSLLQSKLELLKLKTIRDVLNFKTEELCKYYGIGKRNIRLFSDFRQFLVRNPDKVWEYYQNSLCRNIPQNYDPNKSLVDFLKDFFEEYMTFNVVLYSGKQKKIQERKNSILRKFYGLNCSKQTLKAIGDSYRITRERVRQIENKVTLDDLAPLIRNGISQQRNCRVNPESFGRMRTLISSLESYPFFSISSENLLFKEYNINSEHPDINYLYLFFRCLGYERVPSSVCYLARKNLYFLHHNMGRDVFCRIHEIISDFLHEKVIPVSINEIYDHAAQKIKMENPKLVDYACQFNPDIEKTTDGKYQIKYSSLTIQSKIYRILYQEKRIIHFKELREIARKKEALDNSFKYNRISSGFLHSDDKIISLGTTGYWALNNGEQNADTLARLIVKALKLSGSPLTMQQICDTIHQTLGRNDVKNKSVSGTLFINKTKFVRLKNHYYILAEEAHKYRKKIIPWGDRPSERKRIERQMVIIRQCVELLKRAEDNKMPLKELLLALLENNPSYSWSYISQIINGERQLFVKEYLDKKQKQVTLNTTVIKNGNIQLP